MRCVLSSWERSPSSVARVEYLRPCFLGGVGGLCDNSVNEIFTSSDNAESVSGSQTLNEEL